MLLFGRPDIGTLAASKDAKMLIRFLRHSKESRVRQVAAGALGRLGDTRAVGPLTVALGDGDWGVRVDAATALGQIGDARAVGPLLAVLNDEQTLVREHAATALGQLGDTRAVDALLAAVNDQENSVREHVFAALGQLGDGRAVAPLVAALSHGDWPVRRHAADALGRLGDARAVAPLVTALSEQEWLVRSSAAQALDRLGWSPDNGAAGAAYWIARRQWGKCVKIAAIDPLIAATRDERVRADATRTLVKIGARAVDALIGALNDDDDGEVRRAAADALGQIGDPRATGPLLAALNDDHDNYVRRAAAGALGQIGDAGAVDALIAALNDGQPFAAGALGQAGDQRAVGPLIGALHRDRAGDRGTAATALGQIGDQRAVGPLIAALSDQHGFVSAAAADALDRLGWNPDPGPAGAAYWVAKAQWDKCVQAAAVEPLIIALQDYDRREAAARVLGQICDTRAVDPLLALLHDRFPDMGRAAARALVAMYSARKLDEGQKARLLAERDFITYQDHVPEHEGVDAYEDRSIGVAFPL